LFLPQGISMAYEKVLVLRQAQSFIFTQSDFYDLEFVVTIDTKHSLMTKFLLMINKNWITMKSLILDHSARHILTTFTSDLIDFTVK